VSVLIVICKKTIRMNKKITNGFVVGLQAFLSLAFMGAGSIKVVTPFAELRASPGMEWTSDFSAMGVQAIGSVEFLLALALLLSLFLSSLKKYTAVFAAGLALVMVGAAITHLSRGEQIIPNAVLFVFAGIVAWARKARLQSH
jgi:hypothetical protein